MAFGKRVTAPGQPAAAVAQAPAVKVALTSSLFIERATRLKEHVERIFQQAIELAAAIQDAAPISGQELASELEPESFPVDIAGFARHFNFERGGKLKHGVYTYSRADGVLDRAAQLHLLDLTSAIMRLNMLCSRALGEGALSVALQSEAARGDVDRTIVLAGFLAGMLANLVELEYATQAGAKPPSATMLQQKLDDWGTAAHRAMLDPSTFDALAPKFDWPMAMVEAEEDDHAGQLVVNQVYLPADIAGPMRQIMAREQARMLAVA